MGRCAFQSRPQRCMCKLRSIHHSQIGAITPTSCLAKSRIVAQLPGFLNEVLCLVKDLACVGSALAKHDDACSRPSSSHLGQSGASTNPARPRRSCVQHDAVAAARSIPWAACTPFFSKNLSCLNNVVRSAPPSKPVPHLCLVAFSHNCPSRRLARISSHQFSHLQP